MAQNELTPLDFLVEKAKAYVMSPAQEEAHRKSFAYGNSAFENPTITKEIVEEEARRISR
jgi:hypothetical protein